MENTTDKKLVRIAALISQMTDPIQAVLIEIRASNRSRWIVMMAMLAMVVMVSFLFVKSLDKIGDLTSKLSDIQATSVMERGRLNRLISLAERTASTPRIQKELQDLQMAKFPTAENIVKAVAISNPEVILREADKLRMEVSSGTDSSQDPH